MFSHSKVTKPLVTILRNLTSGAFDPDHDVGSVSDPFLQVQLLRTLRALGVGHRAASDAMNDVLMQVHCPHLHSSPCPLLCHFPLTSLVTSSPSFLIADFVEY